MRRGGGTMADKEKGKGGDWMEKEIEEILRRSGGLPDRPRMTPGQRLDHLWQRVLHPFRTFNPTRLLVIGLVLLGVGLILRMFLPGLWRMIVLSAAVLFLLSYFLYLVWRWDSPGKRWRGRDVDGRR